MTLDARTEAEAAPGMARTPHRVVVLVVEGVALAELGHAGDAFRAASQAPGAARERYEVALCAHVPGQVLTREGHQLHVPAGLAALAGADTLVLPGCAPIVASHPADLVAAVRSAHAGGARVVATCTGVSLALAAGVLQGRSATTHWRQEESLTGAHPEVALDPQALFVDHGDVVTGAGTAASMDLYLHLIARDHGEEVAAGVARRLLAPPLIGHRRRPAPSAGKAADRGDPLAAVLEHLAAHLHQREPLAAAAARFGWSERTLRRRFDNQLATTPGRWLAGQRLAQAVHLLEATDLPVEAIAHRLGLASATALRRQLRRELGTTPSAHRATSRAAGPLPHRGASHPGQASR